MSADWDHRSLDDVIEIVSGLVDPNEQPYAEWLHVGGDNIESHTGKLRELKKSKDLGLISGKYAFGADHVLYSKIRPNLNKVAVPDFEGICSADMYPLKPRDGFVTREFLAHLLRSADFLGHALKHSTRTNIPKLNRKALLAYSFPLPPLSEQKRIAAILDAADAMRAKRRESLALLDTLLRSTFLDMFGDPVTNSMGWEERHLPELVSRRKHSLKRGPFGGALKKEIFVPEGFKVYEQKNVIYDDFYIGSYFINKSDYERLVSFKIDPNDLLISCSGTIGRIAAVPADAAPGVMNQALLKIRLDESRILNSFFLGLWRSQPFEQQVLGMTHGTGMKNMKSMNELKSINFIVPPLDLQRRFGAIVESVERQTARHRTHLAGLDTLFASLQSRAFRGDL